MLDRAELVRDVEDGDAELAVEAREQRGERLLGVGVDAGGRLVEDQQPRLGRDRLGDEGPLLLAARTASRSARRPVRSSPTRAIAAATASRSSARERPEQAPPGDAAGGDDLADRGRRLDTQLRPLGQVGDEPATRSDRDGPPEEADGAGLRPARARRSAAERRLAAAVRPGNRDELALGDLQVDVLEHRHAAGRTRRRPREFDG